MKKLYLLAVIVVVAISWWLYTPHVSTKDYDLGLIQLGRKTARTLFFHSRVGVADLVKTSYGPAREAAKALKEEFIPGSTQGIYVSESFLGNYSKMELESYLRDESQGVLLARMVFYPRTSDGQSPNIPGKGDARIEVVARYDELQRKCLVKDFSYNFGLVEYIHHLRQTSTEPSPEVHS